MSDLFYTGPMDRDPDEDAYGCTTIRMRSQSRKDFEVIE